jgi:hypothetical protein
LKPLLPVLEDQSTMVRIGVDGRPEIPEYLRACDLAINLVTAISRKSFSFQIDQKTNYTAAQIAEVRGFLKSLPDR